MGGKKRQKNVASRGNIVIIPDYEVFDFVQCQDSNMKIFNIFLKICMILGRTWVAGVLLIEAIYSAQHEVEDHLAVWIVHA